MEMLPKKWRRIILVCTFISVASGSGLKWVRVNIPQFRVPGEMALLQCDYSLGDDTLYSVKWYKDHEEFYRFVPKANPQTNSYKVEGIHVDTNLSDRKNVVLRNVNYRTSGLFRCEVSAEAPSFTSAQSEARMEIISLPKEDPTISGVEPPYQIGDEINLNCTSGKSHPASVLHWYINEQHVVNPLALIQYQPTQFRNGLVSTTLGLNFILTGRHFVGGAMRVKCVAFVSPILWRGDSESVVRSEAVQETREALLLVKGVASHISVRISYLFVYYLILLYII